MRSDLPSGTVTFLFTDVEGSTKLLHELGAEGYAQALAEHRRVLREAFRAQGGVEVDTQGDAFFVAFPTAPGALAAVREMLAGLASGPIRVRMGLHTGTPFLAEEGYVGPDVNRAARIAACGHGGQVLVSSSTASLIEPSNKLLQGVPLRDLGEHRLKDLSAPERIFQLGEEEFPPLTSLYRTNLPIPSTPFLGRERELTDVVDLLSRDEARLLTLTGPGGTGKTRLAAQAAGLASHGYPDGVWWVPLAPLRDHELVLQTAAQALGAEDGPAEHIADKKMLCLFDNFEQVVDAAPDLSGLLSACPNLDLLVTSREPLHLAGEQEYPVPPLVHEEGVGFFLARARGVKPDFRADDAVSEICRRLDDLPLALELAAARVKALSTAQILDRLEQRLPLLTGGARDAPERQRTLRATIEWSYDLLTEGERRLFARLSVFRGGCTLEAAEKVAEVDLDTLQSLVDKSLLRHSGERFWMLETIREFAAERLEASGETQNLLCRHAEHFVALAEEAEPHFRGSPEEAEWARRLEAEHDNFRAALDDLEASGETQLILQLAGALWRFWSLRGFEAEGRRRIEEALRVDERPTSARARALNAATGMALEDDLATARARAEEALALQLALGDTWGIAYSRYLLGQVTLYERDFASTRRIFEDSLNAFRELDDDHYTLLSIFSLAWALDKLGELVRMRSLEEEGLGLARATGNRRMEAMFLDVVAVPARDEGRIDDALAMLRDALHIYRDLSWSLKVADSLSRIARTLVLAEDGAATAVQLISSADALLDEVGTTKPFYHAERDEETLARARAQLGETEIAEAQEEGRRLTVDEAVALALDTDPDA